MKFISGMSSKPIWTFLLTLTLISALPMVLFAAFVVNRMAEDQRESEVTQLVQRTEALSNAVEQMLLGGVMTLNALASSGELARGDLAGFHREAKDFLRRQSLAGTVAIVNASGKIVFNTRLDFGAPLPQSGESISAVQALKAGRPVVSDLYQSNISGTYVVAINLPLVDGAMAGTALRLVFESSRLNAVLAAQGLPDQWIVSVLDGQRRIIARNRSPEQYVGQVASQEALEFMSYQSSGLNHGSSKEGTPLVRYFHPVDGFGWTIVMGVPDEVLDAPARRSLWTVGAGGVLMLMLAVLAASMLSHRLGRRISQVASVATAIGTKESVAIPRTAIRELDAVIAAQVEAKRLIALRELDLEQINRQLQTAKEEAERANRAKSRFLAAASHDLRQPVQSLFLFHGGLRAGIRDPSSPLDPMLSGAEQSARAMKMILDAMLDVSRIDSGTVKVRPEVLSLGDLLSRMNAEFTAAARAKNLRYRVVGTSLALWTDPALLEQIIRNLIGNALRYTHQGGIVVGCRRRGGMLSIQVVDTGIGIPESAFEEIFEEYVQLANPERDREKGLGLGLSIVRRIAMLLGARITLNSRVGHGSIFAIELPMSASARMPRPFPPVSANQDARGLVVLIDDEPLVLAGLKLMLESWGFDVLDAASGGEAMEKLRRLGKPSPTVIVSDYRLRGGHTGTEAINSIRSTFGIVPPAIVITGDTAPERLREATESGYTVVHKPIAPDDFLTAIRKVIG